MKLRTFFEKGPKLVRKKNDTKLGGSVGRVLYWNNQYLEIDILHIRSTDDFGVSTD